MCPVAVLLKPAQNTPINMQLRFEIFMVVKIQIKFFRVVALRSKTLVSYRNTAWHHSSEELDL
jgi:hypothetical protein